MISISTLTARLPLWLSLLMLATRAAGSSFLRTIANISLCQLLNSFGIWLKICLAYTGGGIAAMMRRVSAANDGDFNFFNVDFFFNCLISVAVRQAIKVQAFTRLTLSDQPPRLL